MLTKGLLCFLISLSGAVGQSPQVKPINSTDSLSIEPHKGSSLKPESSLSFGLGLNYSALKNETVSPLIHAGLGVPIALAYRREGTRSKQYVQLGFLSHTMSSPFDNLTNELRGSLGYTYLRRVKHWPTMNLYAGTEIVSQVSYRNNPSPTLPANNNDYSMINMLSPTVLVDYRIQNHKLEGQLVAAGIGYNLRADSNFEVGIKDESFKSIVAAGRVETVPTFLSGSIRLSYFPPRIARHTYWRFDYVGMLQRFQQQQYFGIVQYQVIGSISYQF